jgi:hypothetical protein
LLAIIADGRYFASSDEFEMKSTALIASSPWNVLSEKGPMLRLLRFRLHVFQTLQEEDFLFLRVVASERSNGEVLEENQGLQHTFDQGPFFIFSPFSSRRCLVGFA